MVNGGGKRGSSAILKALSINVGIILVNIGDYAASKQGFVFISINHTLKLSSIMKSMPNTSNECYLLNGSILPYTD